MQKKTYFMCSSNVLTLLWEPDKTGHIVLQIQAVYENNWLFHPTCSLWHIKPLYHMLHSHKIKTPMISLFIRIFMLILDFLTGLPVTFIRVERLRGYRFLYLPDISGTGGRQVIQGRAQTRQPSILRTGALLSIYNVLLVYASRPKSI